MAKTEMLRVRFSPAELALLAERAKAASMSMSAFVRSSTLGDDTATKNTN